MTRNADDTSMSRRDTPMSRRGFFRAGAAGVAATGAVTAGSGTVAAAYDGWLDDVENYDGTHDYRGREEVRVEVGAGNGLQFGPAAILIDPGTTVVWEWTGEGGDHNVAAEDGSFESDTVGEAGHTFEHAFDDAADGDVFEYVCTPHEAVGMKGVVAVGDVDDDLVDPDGGDDGGDGGGSGRELTAEDLGALALAFGFAGALLVPLFYAAHKRTKHDE
ncbi:halocyanin domain-containing protein [Halorubrum sp. DTA98]|uniref:halocyanin domain-containing protein n=1 Tax=Halorubrum sp. DTA98 TaxID=3402163 RepID=UPI003AAE8706